MATDRTAPVEAALAADVEELLEPVEPAAVFRDTRECLGSGLLSPLLLLSSPAPRPKTNPR
ncbi:hypothetical protein ACH427_27890 [Streptomyces sp. NPDC020379]|uniref:hypothetical protein n=1 Tax=Streptomyces sp. NPDC020379 TaxID=3365071 RepID=UPI0037BA5B6A